MLQNNLYTRKFPPQKKAPQPKTGSQEPSAVGEADSEDEALADASGGTQSKKRGWSFWLASSDQLILIFKEEAYCWKKSD